MFEGISINFITIILILFTTLHFTFLFKIIIITFIYIRLIIVIESSWCCCGCCQHLWFFPIDDAWSFATYRPFHLMANSALLEAFCFASTNTAALFFALIKQLLSRIFCWNFFSFFYLSFFSFPIDSTSFRMSYPSMEPCTFVTLVFLFLFTPFSSIFFTVRRSAISLSFRLCS